jgi:hypothetical protein
VAPAVPEVREAVNEQHRRAVLGPRFRHVKQWRSQLVLGWGMPHPSISS